MKTLTTTLMILALTGGCDMINSLPEWADTGTKENPETSEPGKIALGWVTDERPALEWENYLMNKRDVKINEMIDTSNVYENQIEKVITDAGLTPDLPGDLGQLSDAIFDSKAVDTPAIADGAVTAVKIASNAVTNSKLADGVVTTNKLYNMSVTTDKLGTAAVTNTKVHSISVDKLIDGDINIPYNSTGDWWQQNKSKLVYESPSGGSSLQSELKSTYLKIKKDKAVDNDWCSMTRDSFTAKGSNDLYTETTAKGLSFYGTNSPGTSTVKDAEIRKASFLLDDGFYNEQDSPLYKFAYGDFWSNEGTTLANTGIPKDALILSAWIHYTDKNSKRRVLPVSRIRFYNGSTSLSISNIGLVAFDTNDEPDETKGDATLIIEYDATDLP